MAPTIAETIAKEPVAMQVAKAGVKRFEAAIAVR